MFTIIEYSQNEYGSIVAAEAAINTELFVKNPGVATASFRAWLIVKKEATDLTDASLAKFIGAGRLGDILRS